MKTIYEKTFGGDGMVEGLYVDMENGYFVQQTKYPMTKALGPVDQIINKIIDGVEARIPGDWDKALLEPVRAEAHAEIKKIVGG